MDLHLSISNGFVSSKIYEKRDNFDFDIVNFPVLDDDVPSSTSYGVYISQLIRIARVSSHAADFNARNKSLTANVISSFFSLINYPIYFLTSTASSNLLYGVIYCDCGKFSYLLIFFIILFNQCLLHLFILFISLLSSHLNLLHLFTFLEILYTKLLILNFNYTVIY